MVHKLVIQPEFHFLKKYEKVLGEGELPQGIFLNIDFHVTNIGEKEFPGGTLKELSVNFETGIPLGGLKSFHTLNEKIESIPVNKTKIIFTWNTIFKQVGLAWLRCIIKLKDEKEQIQFYQTRESSEWESDWQNAYYVQNRLNLDIIDRLDKIEGKLS